jgi:hypothetical protein
LATVLENTINLKIFLIYFFIQFILIKNNLFFNQIIQLRLQKLILKRNEIEDENFLSNLCKLDSSNEMHCEIYLQKNITFKIILNKK